jgi:uncharacterized protein (TIGR00297 family)
MTPLVGGFDSTNLAISLSLVVILVVASKIRHILDTEGTIAAAILGLIVGILGHWTWLIILLTFLMAGFVATRWRWEEKLAKGFAEGEDGERAWTNVIANGGVPGIIAIWAFSTGEWSAATPLYAAAVGVAAADTFASEFGCLDERVRMITTMKSCEQGINGGFSPNGQFAAIAGAALVGVVAIILQAALAGEFDAKSAGLFIGFITTIGFIGCQIDSVLGAVLENRGYIGKGTVNALAISSGTLLAFPLLAYFGL